MKANGGRSLASRLAELGQRSDRTLKFMEVCGTHTMAAARSGLRSLLPANVRLISGPGCPVCVTPVGYVDHALALAARPEVIVATFGDLMRVPGSAPAGEARNPPSLARARAAGADVRTVYSPADALRLARDNPERVVVFLGVGFETTTPTIAAALLAAEKQAVTNFTVLSANKTVPIAMEVLAGADDLGLDGFLCPGHVSIIIGPEPYSPLVDRFGVACAIAGFEPAEIVAGVESLVDQVLSGRPAVDNTYASVVRPGGNERARALVEQVFEPCDSVWRGVGLIPGTGLQIVERLAGFDAARRFDVDLPEPVEPPGCRCGEVLRGVIEPSECPLFGRVCTPQNPRGACMVSSEGSCAASYLYAEDPVDSGSVREVVA